MTIKYNSRYADGVLLKVQPEARPISQNSTSFVLRSFPSQITATYGTYEWRDGDRMDRIAGFFLRDPYRWWELMDMNPDITHPSDIRPGQTIRVPISEVITQI